MRRDTCMEREEIAKRDMKEREEMVEDVGDDPVSGHEALIRIGREGKL